MGEAINAFVRPNGEDCTLRGGAQRWLLPHEMSTMLDLMGDECGVAGLKYRCRSAAFADIRKEGS